MMQLEKVQYRKGRPFLSYFNHKKNMELTRVFGEIRQCPVCGKDSFFRNDSLKKGLGFTCSRKCRKSHFASSWGGGIQHKNGYVLHKIPQHPSSDNQGYVYEHRLIIEKEIGRLLHTWEIVHHINQIRDDNRIENLQVLTASEHSKLHNHNKGGK